jgi:hypothetical protein
MFQSESESIINSLRFCGGIVVNVYLKLAVLDSISCEKTLNNVLRPASSDRLRFLQCCSIFSVCGEVFVVRTIHTGSTGADA